MSGVRFLVRAIVPALLLPAVLLDAARAAPADVVNAIAGGYAPYVAAPPVTRPASMEAAAVEAAYRVLVVELPSQQAALDAARAASLAPIAEPYTPGSGPGVWIPTPPGFLPAAAPFLGQVVPFTMRSASQFRPEGPPRLGSRQYVRDYDEVKSLGEKQSLTRTPEQTATALFWEPLAGTVWPASIRRMATERGLDIATAARFEAATFAAFADGLIGCWEAKYHFNSWRPVTAIRAADTDGTPRTEPDPAWEPLAITPAFPEYPSGHACATTAVANVMEDFFSHELRIAARNVNTGEERFYTRARDVVDEVVEARMLLGVHFRAADEDGSDIGRRIARRIRTKFFKRDSECE
jgi:hypothetical protein